MNTPPPLPQKRPIPLPAPTVDIPKGIIRPIASVISTVFLADFLFLDYMPGLSVGVFGAFLGLLVLTNRTEQPKKAWHWATFLLLGLSCAQSARFLSLSNILAITILLFCLSGFSAHSKLPKAWLRWCEGLLSIVRPFGAMFTFQTLIQQKQSAKSMNPERIKYAFAILLPALCLLFIFGWLLGSGNAVLGKWTGDFFSAFFDYLAGIQFPTFRRFVWWSLFATLTLILVCPPKASSLSAKLDLSWRQFGVAEGSLRLHQWLACLGALNLLFLLSNVTDVIFLWFSRELPPGIYHSDYVHQGVYALIATTILSAMIMALLTQHHAVVSQNHGIRILALVWMVQNLILISGVFFRLWIYVDAYGYTPKRVYVALFLALVILGYGLLGWAILRNQNIKWLTVTNLILVFSYFSGLQFVDTPKWVTHQNIALYQADEIQYPEELFFKQVSSHSIPYLLGIIDHPQNAKDQQQALIELKKQSHNRDAYKLSGWRGFQKRHHKNYQLLSEFNQSKATYYP